MNSSKSGLGKLEGIVAGFLIALTIGLGYLVKQNEFNQIITFYTLFFVVYISTFRLVKKQSKIRFYLSIGIILRVLLLFSLPNLSDDIYRFIWDGRLLISGHHPFEFLPSYYIENGISIRGIEHELYEKLNSPEYFTIYPPTAQLIFAIACWIFPTSILGASIIMKLFLVVFEIGSILLIVRILQHLRLPSKNVLLYALNPLIIVEITGNLHFEGAMIFFFLLGVWVLIKAPSIQSRVSSKAKKTLKKNQKLPSQNVQLSLQKWFQSSLFVALSVASKLLSLIFLPLFVKRLGWKKSIQYFFIIGVCLILFFMPFMSETFLNNFGDSLNLYFQKFEFNASVYYIARWIGFQYIGYNLISYIGPALALTAFLVILGFTFFEKEISWSSFFEKALFIICTYLFFTTTIHPWYLSLPIVLCLFTTYRFPILWSSLIFLTYINYSYQEYFENLWIVGLEYSLVLSYLIYEMVSKLKTKRAWL